MALILSFALLWCYFHRGSDPAVRLCLIPCRSGEVLFMCDVCKRFRVSIFVNFHVMPYTTLLIDQFASQLIFSSVPDHVTFLYRPTSGCAVCQYRWRAEQMLSTCHLLVSIRTSAVVHYLPVFCHAVNIFKSMHAAKVLSSNPHYTKTKISISLLLLVQKQSLSQLILSVSTPVCQLYPGLSPLIFIQNG